MAPDLKKENPPKKNNLVLRVISALVMLPAAIYLILTGGLPFFILINFLTILILMEWNGITTGKPFSLVVAIQILCAILIMLQINFASPYIELAFASSVVSVIAVAYLAKVKIKWAITGFLYALLPSASFLIINETGGGYVILWMMIVIWSMDTGAYFVGKSVGGPKMSPKISPNKTWSGLIGGAITAMLMSAIYMIIVENQNVKLFEDVTILLFLSGVLAILSQIGDLAESAVKRKFNIKDSGSIIPGHGGVMDRLDGILFVAPAVVLLVFML